VKGFDKEGDIQKGMFLVNHCRRIIQQAKPVFWCIENPGSGKLKEILGPPQFQYQPWEFGSPWTKLTALWGNFNIPTKLYTKWDDVPKNDKLYMRPGRKKPGLAFLHKSAISHIPEFAPFKSSIVDDNGFRSLCPQGFAKAFFDVNQ